MTTIIVLMIVYSFLCAIFANIVANAKNQNGVSWFFAGLFFGIIGLTAAAGMPALPTPTKKKSNRDNIALWRCPNCETMQQGYLDKCGKCGTPRPA